MINNQETLFQMNAVWESCSADLLEFGLTEGFLPQPHYPKDQPAPPGGGGGWN